MVDILVKGGSGWRDPLVAQFGSQEMELPPPPSSRRRSLRAGAGSTPPPDLRWNHKARRASGDYYDADFSLEHYKGLARRCTQKRNMPEHFAFCALKGSGAADDVQYAEGVKQLEGACRSSRSRRVADVVEPHPSLEHPIAGLPARYCSVRRAAGAGSGSRRSDTFTATETRGVTSRR